MEERNDAPIEAITFDAHIARDEQFNPPTMVAPNQRVFLYRRLQDARYPGKIAVVDDDIEPIGYLDDEEFAEKEILPRLMAPQDDEKQPRENGEEPPRFECYIAGDEAGGRIPLLILYCAPMEAIEALKQRGMFAQDDEYDGHEEAEDADRLRDGPFSASSEEA